jgi:hypothetical protein
MRLMRSRLWLPGVPISGSLGEAVKGEQAQKGLVEGRPKVGALPEGRDIHRGQDRRTGIESAPFGQRKEPLDIIMDPLEAIVAPVEDLRDPSPLAVSRHPCMEPYKR